MRSCLAQQSLRLLAARPCPRHHLVAAAAAAARRPALKASFPHVPRGLRRLPTHTTAAAASEGDGAMTVLPPPPIIDVKPQLLSVAPMMDWTDVYYRQLARLISRHTWLYTEMVVDQTLLHTPHLDKFLWFPPEQRPIVCQLGGSNPELLAKAAKLVERYGYDEINLNCGCPSDRVAGAGCFGAAMMLRPQVVADCCRAMREAVSSPITVKCRLGVDDVDSYEALATFVRQVHEGSGVSHFIVHARKCHLKGLNPHQNRTVPPLRYQWVWALKRDFPHIDFSLNGGVLTLEETAAALRLINDGAAAGDAAPAPSGDGEAAAAAAAEAAEAAEAAAVAAEAADAVAAASGGAVPPGASAGSSGRAGVLGVMVGRAAYNMPWDVLADADRAVFGAPANAATSRRAVMREYAAWADRMIGHWRVDANGYKSPNVRALVKPLLGMFHGEPRAKKWRAAVDTSLKTAATVSEVLDATFPVLREESLDAPPRMMGAPPDSLAHYAPDLPPTPACLSERGASPDGSETAAEQQQAAEAAEPQQAAEQMAAA